MSVDDRPDPMPVTVADYLAYFGLAPQVLSAEAATRTPAVRGSASPPAGAPRREDPWGPTTPPTARAARVGRKLAKVLRLPRDQPLLDFVLHAVRSSANRLDAGSFADIRVLLHAIAFRVVSQGYRSGGSAVLRLLNLEIEYPEREAFRAWLDALEVLEEMVGDRARAGGGRPASDESHRALVLAIFLNSPPRWWSYQELAEEVGLEPGQVEAAMPRVREAAKGRKWERQEDDGRVHWRLEGDAGAA